MATNSVSATHSRNSSNSSEAISLSASSRPQIPPPPHPNRLIPQPSAPASTPRSSPPSNMNTNDVESPSISRSNSFVIDTSIHLTRISSPSHLKSLPSDFLSEEYTVALTTRDGGDKAQLHKCRPLLHIDEAGHEYKYYLQPMKMAVIYILVVEMLERFSFYGINYTTTAYLTGEYNEEWNADLPSITASSYVSISTAVAYTTPFIGALLADNILGEYTTVLLGSVLCYIPGLLLIALTTIPQFLGNHFNASAVRWGLLILWPIGTGMVKACVNVFGAKQFHPILQSSLIETYYVNFYMCINIGALTGGIIVPIVAQWNVSVAYFIPVVILGLGVGLFVAGGGKYVKPKPKQDLHLVLSEVGNAVMRCCGRQSSSGRRTTQKYSRIQPSTSESKVGIGTIALVSGLVVPFNVAYAQMATTFILQGTVMKNYWIIDAPMMNNADAISVLAFGYLIGNIIYPALNERQIKIPTTYKFAIGSAFGAAAVGCAILTDYAIHAEYKRSGESITVLWQVWPYFLIGIGEIFAVSAAYEFAFTVAPAKMKTLASAANLFMVGGAPNVFCILLYNACASWFLNSRGTTNIHHLKDYATAKVVNYFWILELICIFGIVINVLPSVKNWVADLEDAAAETVKSPMSTPSIRKTLMQRRKLRKESGSSGSISFPTQSQDTNEETPLVKTKKHQNYLKYGSAPVLMKSGSMRAGPSLKNSPQRVKRQQDSTAAVPLQVREKLLGLEEAKKASNAP
ncbi:hypothetical protein ACHAWO_003830 [Cyclotella atomus]|uniref:Uncharacterized protein n=1 Tax=Cyclotella atomus TaxID=382360 RepID=A0ABD3QU08_9STRA